MLGEVLKYYQQICNGTLTFDDQQRAARLEASLMRVRKFWENDPMEVTPTHEENCQDLNIDAGRGQKRKDNPSDLSAGGLEKPESPPRKKKRQVYKCRHCDAVFASWGPRKRHESIEHQVAQHGVSDDLISLPLIQNVDECFPLSESLQGCVSKNSEVAEDDPMDVDNQEQLPGESQVRRIPLALFPSTYPS